MISLENFVQNYSQYSDLTSSVRTETITFNQQSYPLISLRFGQADKPTLLICGGIHGLERIGAQLAVSLLNSFYERLTWDQVLKNLLNHVQVVFIPLANPIGYFNTTRSNGAGVDLMRNAPIEAEDPTPFLLGGHRKSANWPWYRGNELQTESQFVLSEVQNILKQSKVLISLDLHSGFGFQDQIWFPYAYSKKKFPQISHLYLLFQLFEKSFPHHIYKIEPQSKNYLTHGDLWDYSFLNYKSDEQVYLPLTLEMGSWIWVKKNPLQLFNKTGLFNPIKQHRMNRTFRRHRPLFDFLLHALASHETWSQSSQLNSEVIQQKAYELYY